MGDLAGRLTVTANPLLQLVYFRQRWILPAGSEEVAERFERDAAIATLVEEGEGFFVVCRGLCFVEVVNRRWGGGEVG